MTKGQLIASILTTCCLFYLIPLSTQASDDVVTEEKPLNAVKDSSNGTHNQDPNKADNSTRERFREPFHKHRYAYWYYPHPDSRFLYPW